MDCKDTEEDEGELDKTAKPAIILRIKRSGRKRYTCSVCPCSYTQITNLKYHIRREHFNLKLKINGRDKRKINEVWLERVLNSDDIVQIKRTAHNKYLIKKCNDPGAGEIAETVGVLDLTPVYPDLARAKSRSSWCRICQKKFLKMHYRRHLEEDHEDLMI